MACTPPKLSSYPELVAESRALLHEAKAEAIRERESVCALDKTRRNLATALDQAAEQRTASRLARQAARDMQYRVEAESRCQAARRQEIRRKRLEDYQSELREIHTERRRREADSERWWTDKLLGVLEEQVDHSCADMRRVRGEISRTRGMLAREARGLFAKHGNCPGASNLPGPTSDVSPAKECGRRDYAANVAGAVLPQQPNQPRVPVHTHLHTHVNHAAPVGCASTTTAAALPFQNQGLTHVYDNSSVLRNTAATATVPGMATSNAAAGSSGNRATTTTYTTSHMYPGTLAATNVADPTSFVAGIVPSHAAIPYPVYSGCVPQHQFQQQHQLAQAAPAAPAVSADGSRPGGVFFKRGSAGVTTGSNHLGEPTHIVADDTRIQAALPSRFPPAPPPRHPAARERRRPTSAMASAPLPRREATSPSPRERPLSSGSLTPELLADESASEESDGNAVFAPSSDDDEELVRSINTPTRRRRLKQMAATSPRPRPQRRLQAKVKHASRSPSAGRLVKRAVKDDRPLEDGDTASELEAQLAARHDVLLRERENLAQIDKEAERKNRSHCSHLMRAITHANAEIKGLRKDQHRTLAKERARSRKLERQLTKLEHCYRRVQAAKPRHSWVPSGYGTC